MTAGLPSTEHGAVQDRLGRDRIRAYARSLERNSDIIEPIVLAMERNVVGLGFRLQARVTDIKGEPDEAINRLLESLWEEHGRARNFDVQARQSRTEMLRMAVRRRMVDGGMLLVKCNTPGGTVPLCWQMREVDELDSTIAMMQRGDNYIVDGIEFDANGRRIAYWFRRYAPDGFQMMNSERIDADRVIFLEKFNRLDSAAGNEPILNKHRPDAAGGRLFGRCDEAGARNLEVRHVHQADGRRRFHWAFRRGSEDRDHFADRSNGNPERSYHDRPAGRRGNGDKWAATRL